MAEFEALGWAARGSCSLLERVSFKEAVESLCRGRTANSSSALVPDCAEWICMFFNLFAAVEPHTSVKVTHGTPCIDPWVQRLISPAEQTPTEKTKVTKMANYIMNFDRISIVFNQTRWTRRSLTASYIVPAVPTSTQKTYHVDPIGQIRVFNFL